MATKETQEHIWDIEDELDDAKSTIQSQATQIQLQKDQLKRLRLALRAKEHEISELKDESTAANTIDTEQKNIKDERLIAESAMFQEADDIREQIIEVGDPEIQTIQIPNQAGRIEHRGDKASDETHNVLTQQSSTNNDAVFSSRQAASAARRDTRAGFGQNIDLSISISQHAPIADDCGFQTPAAGRSGPNKTPHAQRRGRTAASKSKLRRRRQEPMGILVGTLKYSGSRAGAAYAVYGSRDRSGRVNRRISKEDPYGRVVIGDRMEYVTACSHADINYVDRFRHMTKEEVDAQILRLLGHTSTTSPSTSNPSTSTAGMGPQTGIKSEIEDDDGMQDVDATEEDRKWPMVKVED